MAPPEASGDAPVAKRSIRELTLRSVKRTHDGAVLVRWWILVIIMSLLKWAFYVLMKIALLANARNLYEKNKAKA